MLGIIIFAGSESARPFHVVCDLLSVHIVTSGRSLPRVSVCEECGWSGDGVFVKEVSVWGETVALVDCVGTTELILRVGSVYAVKLALARDAPGWSQYRK